MARREEPDPLLLQTVSERLARLLAESAPPGPSAETPPVAPATSTERGGDGGLEPVDDLPAAPRFRRVHVGVVAALLLAGLLWAGWSVLRARPVALADPGVVAVSPVVVPPGTPPAATAVPSAPVPPAGAPPGSAGPAAAARVVVHVLGAVREPGLVTLPAPARVQDAVDAAGGFTRRADAAELNLAQLLEDGQQVVVGTDARPEGEVRDSGGGSGGGAGTPSEGSDEQVLDLNQAAAGQLEELPGVGPVTAAAIVAWREEHGRFSRIEELQEVDGIGPKTYAQIAPHVRV